MVVETPDVLSAPRLLNGHYRVDERIRSSQFSDVERAWDTTNERYVAIKALKRRASGIDRDEYEDVKRRFVQEARAYAKIGINPYILTFYESFLEKGLPHIVLEYMESGTLLAELGSRLDAGDPLSLNDALRMTKEIALGLSAAHATGIVHRDVKPANIFLGASGQAKLGDFGVAQMDDDFTGRRVNPTEHPGTNLYMSPEQRTPSGPLTPSSDQYSLGLVLFEMLTGGIYKRMFSRTIEDALATYAESIHSLIHRMLEEDPEQRYPSMKEVVDRINGIEQEQSSSKHMDHIAQIGKSYTRRTVLAGIGGGVLGTILTTASAIAYVRSHPSGDPSKVSATPPIAFLPAPTLPVPITPGTRSLSTLPPPATAQVQEVITTVPVLAGTIVPRPVSGISVDSASRAVELARWGHGFAVEAKWTKGGEYLVVGTSIGVLLFRKDDLAFISYLRTEQPVRVLSLSPDDQTAAAGFEDGSIILLKLADDSTTKRLYGHADGITALVFSPDGSILASASKDRTIRLWGVSEAKPIRVLTRLPASVQSIDVSPDGQLIAAALDGSTPVSSVITLFRVSDGGIVGTCAGHTSGVRDVCFSPDGKILASGSEDNSIKLWRVADKTLISTLEGHKSGVLSVQFAPGGKTLGSGSYDGSVRLWRVEDGTPLRVFVNDQVSVYSLSFSPDGSIATVYGTGGVSVRTNVDDQTPKTIDQLTNAGTSFELSPKGETLVSGGYEDSGIYLWRTSDGAMRSITTDVGDLTELKFSPSNDSIAFTGSYDHRIKLLHLSGNGPPLTLEGHTAEVSDIGFFPDGQTLVSASSDKTIRLWRVSDGMLTQTISSDDQTFRAVTYLRDDSDNDKVLASGSDDGSLRFWRIRDSALLVKQSAPNNGAARLLVSPTREFIASWGIGSGIHLWRINSGDWVRTLGGYSPLSGVTFSQDGEMIAAIMDYGAIQIWRISDGQTVTSVSLYRRRVNTIAFSPDGQIIAVGLDDNTIRLLSPRDGTWMSTLRGHSDEVTQVAFSRDSLILFSASRDGTVRLWGVH